MTGRKTIQTVIILLCMFMTTPEGFAQKKLAQTGLQFLSVGTDARSTAMGEAFATIEGTATSLFYNPAGMARIGSFIDVTASVNNWIADIDYNAVALAISPFDGRFGTVGFSLMNVDYGELQGTMVAGNGPGYEDTEMFNPTAFAVGVGYSAYLSDKFAVGAHLKTVAQQLGKSIISLGSGILADQDRTIKKNVVQAVAFDFGTIYRTGFRSFTFGMSVQNFSDEVKFEKEGFQLPLTFRIGASVNAFDFLSSSSSNQSLLVSVDALHPRSYPEYLRVGLEYDFLNTLFARFGFVTAQSQYDVTYGVGIQKFGIGFDYSYTPFGLFEGVSRATIRLSI